MTDAMKKPPNKAVELLQQLIATPSFSREEDRTATIIDLFLNDHGVATQRLGNNVWAVNKYFDPLKPTILLNSHHDTVKPNVQYTRDPFAAVVDNGKLYGLGSNDAGGCLVSLIAAFLHYYGIEGAMYNLAIAATAEEEISGTGGVEALLADSAFHQAFLPGGIAGAIVGEPTLLQMALAERGLMVLDVLAEGKSGHAARNEGDNAIYKAIADICWFRDYRFDKVSDLLGPVSMNVTVIDTHNKAHNVVPGDCHMVVDVRVNEQYTFEEIVAVIRNGVQATVTPRSTRLRSTAIDKTHPLVRSGLALNLSGYGSPTTSDKALMPFPALKIGPGDSARSHSADEFIYVTEIEQGIDLYIKLLYPVLTGNI